MNTSLTFEIIKIASTAILSFVSGYVLFRFNKQKDKKEISYDLKITNGLLDIKELIKNDIQIFYKNKSTDKLTYVELDLYNSGNLIIKNQEIRLECPPENRILEVFYEPKIEPELHFEEIISALENERKFKIGHFERNQKIGLRLIVAGDNVEVNIHKFNPEGNVNFNPKIINKSIDEKGKIIAFFSLILLFFTFPSAISQIMNVDGNLGTILSGLFKTIILIFIIKRMDAISIIVNKFYNSENKDKRQIFIYNDDESENRINIE